MRCDEAIDALALLANCPLKEGREEKGRQQASRQTPVLHHRGCRCSVEALCPLPYRFGLPVVAEVAKDGGSPQKRSELKCTRYTV